MKERGLIRYEQKTTYGDNQVDVTVKEYDTSMSNLFFGLIAVSIFSLSSVAIAKMIFTTPSVVIQQQQPTRTIGY